MTSQRTLLGRVDDLGRSSNTIAWKPLKVRGQTDLEIGFLKLDLHHEMRGCLILDKGHVYRLVVKVSMGGPGR